MLTTAGAHVKLSHESLTNEVGVATEPAHALILVLELEHDGLGCRRDHKHLVLAREAIKQGRDGHLGVGHGKLIDACNNRTLRIARAVLAKEVLLGLINHRVETRKRALVKASGIDEASLTDLAKLLDIARIEALLKL